MSRAKNPASLYFKGILTIKDGVYTLTELGVNYHLTYNQFNSLKSSRCSLVVDWYNSLDRFAKPEIARTGILPDVDNGFYPDE